jgi:hypothetical protein
MARHGPCILALVQRHFLLEVAMHERVQVIVQVALQGSVLPNRSIRRLLRNRFGSCCGSARLSVYARIYYGDETSGRMKRKARVCSPVVFVASDFRLQTPGQRSEQYDRESGPKNGDGTFRHETGIGHPVRSHTAARACMQSGTRELRRRRRKSRGLRRRRGG